MKDEPQAPCAPSASSWRVWVTGRAPHGAVLAPPIYHDTSSAPETAWGARCPTQACRKQDPTAMQSLRYVPSGICVACWSRWDKTVTNGEDANPHREEEMHSWTPISTTSP
jgi:hypothetical protein